MFQLTQGQRGQHLGVLPLKASFQMQPIKKADIHQVSEAGMKGGGFLWPHALLLRLQPLPHRVCSPF